MDIELHILPDGGYRFYVLDVNSQPTGFVDLETLDNLFQNNGDPSVGAAPTFHSLWKPEPQAVTPSLVAHLFDNAKGRWKILNLLTIVFHLVAQAAEGRDRQHDAT